MFISNSVRFGSGFEFGHSLKLSNIDAMRYASRFDHPYSSEPFWSSAMELGSLLSVSGQKLNNDDDSRYTRKYFVGQSMKLTFEAPRREIYQSGLQMVFVAFMTPEELSPDGSRFRLLGVRWKQSGDALN